MNFKKLLEKIRNTILGTEEQEPHIQTMDVAHDVDNTLSLCDKAWNAYQQKDINKALNYFKNIDTNQRKQLRKVAKYLYSYNHPQLKNVSDSTRQLFRLALAKSWFSLKLCPNDVNSKYIENHILAELIGSNYALTIDPNLISDALYGDNYTEEQGVIYKLPASYNEHHQLWPELATITTVSLEARIVFLLIIEHVQIRSGMTDIARINPNNSENIAVAIDELVSAQLIDKNLNLADLLMNFSVVELKQFALDNGLKAKSTKNKLCALLVSEVAEEKIRTLFTEKNANQRQIRPLIKNLPTFKKYVWAEINRLKLYTEWLERVKCLGIAPKRYSTKEKKAFVQPNRIDPMIPNPYDVTIFSREETSYTRHEQTLELIHTVWDKECDNITIQLTKEHGWYSPRYIGQAVLDYVKPEVKQLFEAQCWEKIGHPYWVLTYYSITRIYELKIPFSKPRQLTCAGCQVQFIEWSISENIAKQVDNKFHFCPNCYQIACWHDNTCSNVKPPQKQVMLKTLADLADALEAIPTQTFMKKPQLNTLSDEKQIKVVRVLLQMVSYKEYNKEFGSWLNALSLAGVLHDNTQPMGRGFRCIANDGHECLSLAEKTIDDWLSNHHITHNKEPMYPYDFHLNPSGQMRADWQVGEILIEYAGLLNDPEYAAKMDNKKNLAEKFCFTLIILEPKDLLSLDKKLGYLTNN